MSVCGGGESFKTPNIRCRKYLWSALTQLSGHLSRVSHWPPWSDVSRAAWPWLLTPITVSSTQRREKFGHICCYHQGRSLRGGKGGNCPPWDFQFLKIIYYYYYYYTWYRYLLRRHCPPAYLGQATALIIADIPTDSSIIPTPEGRCATVLLFPNQCWRIVKKIMQYRPHYTDTSSQRWDNEDL